MRLILLILLITTLAYGIYHFYTTHGVKTPPYQVEQQVNNIEIRVYEPMIIASILTEGEQYSAINQGFRALANYIFDNEIAMTAPVQQRPQIAMTAPVTQQAEAERWKISFVMPADATMQSLPKPLNPKVQLEKIPQQRWVVIRFSGRWTEANRQIHLKQLDDYIQAQKLVVSGPAKYAYYNPPWTLPLLRRNEIMYLLK